MFNIYTQIWDVNSVLRIIDINNRYDKREYKNLNSKNRIEWFVDFFLFLVINAQSNLLQGLEMDLHSGNNFPISAITLKRKIFNHVYVFNFHFHNNKKFRIKHILNVMICYKVYKGTN